MERDCLQGALMQSGNYAEAEVPFRKLLAISDNDPRIAHNLANASEVFIRPNNTDRGLNCSQSDNLCAGWGYVTTVSPDGMVAIAIGTFLNQSIYIVALLSLLL